MAKRILTLVHGDKGGIGKSMTSNTVADYLLSSGLANDLVIVDADQRNPDVSRMFPAQSVQINLLNHTGWNELYDLIAERSGSDFLINLPAQAGLQIPAEKDTLRAFLADQDMQMVMFFPIDRLNDTVNLLKLAISDLLPITKSHVAIIKNLFFGAADKFDKFDRSDVRASLEKGKAKMLEMPELNADVVSAVMGDYHSENPTPCVRFTELLASKPRPSMKFDLEKWLKVMFDQFETVYQPLVSKRSAPAKGE